MKKNIPEEKLIKTNSVSPNMEKRWISNTLQYFFSLAGLLIAVYIGYWYAGYSKQLHENEMWFSNIKVLFSHGSYNS